MLIIFGTQPLQHPSCHLILCYLKLCSLTLCCINPGQSMWSECAGGLVVEAAGAARGRVPGTNQQAGGFLLLLLAGESNKGRGRREAKFKGEEERRWDERRATWTTCLVSSVLLRLVFSVVSICLVAVTMYPFSFVSIVPSHSYPSSPQFKFYPVSSSPHSLLCAPFLCSTLCFHVLPRFPFRVPLWPSWISWGAVGTTRTIWLCI